MATNNMAYASAPIKPDSPSENKFFFICRTPGCGETINKEFPTADKDPSPQKCKLCMDKDTRNAIIADHQQYEIQ